MKAHDLNRSVGNPLLMSDHRLLPSILTRIWRHPIKSWRKS